MKRLVGMLCFFLMLFAAVMPAQAANFYIIPDSNIRKLTREELWEWQYDALGFIFNEIFARHGYHFESGKKYDSYFKAQVWYAENTKYDNQGIHKNLMTDIDWYNERLCKEVREEMRALGTLNPAGKPLPTVSYEPPIYGAFSSFVDIPFAPNQKMSVYSGPGTQYHRAANGKASVSTNGHVYVGGWENGWLMVMYWTNDSNVRVGYVQSKEFTDKVNAPTLSFEYTSATTSRQCVLTDDPVATYQPLATLPQGTSITYLSEYVNENRWAYVEVRSGGVLMRGFLPTDAVLHATMETDAPPLAPDGVYDGNG